jgi:hypothetical protein
MDNAQDVVQPRVFTKRNGIGRVVTNQAKGVFIKGLSRIILPTDLDVYICTDCGYFEEYVTDHTKLSKIQEVWDKVG